MTDSKQKKSQNSDDVVFIQDPFQLETEALPEFESDLSPQEVDEQFERMGKAVEEADRKTALELEKAIARAQQEEPPAENPEAELARQIREDEALAAQEKAEADNPELSEEFRAALPRVDENGELDQAELQSCLEAVLFMADKPLTLAKLRELIGEQFPKDAFVQALTAIRGRYASVHHGFELVEVAGGYQYRTKVGRAPLARKLARVQVQRLSRGAMETLTLIAYKQPCLKEDVDQIRGVDSAHFIRGLLDRGLIEMAGRSELPGRPILYRTTDLFLQVFGLKDLGALPPLQEIEAMIPSSENLSDDDGLGDVDPKVRQMRKLVSQMNSDPERIEYDHRSDEAFLAEIRERVKAIPVSTPYIDELKAIEKNENPPSA